MRVLSLVIAACVGTAFADDELVSLENLYGRDELVAVIGNGALTVGTDRLGRVSVCRWPSPGLQDHLSYRVPAPASFSDSPRVSQGLGWGLQLGDEIIWLTDSRWTIVQDYARGRSNVLNISASLEGTSVAVLLTMFVEPRSDVLVARLNVEGVDDPPRIFWSADFTPCTRLLPELPVADWGTLDRLNDFAVFALEAQRTVYHFRPFYPDAAMWDSAHRLAAKRPTFAEWKAFGDGVWIAYSSPQSIVSYQCESESTLGARRESGPRHVAVGHCRSMIEITPDRQDAGYHASVLVAFGRDADLVNAVLRRSLAQDPELAQQLASEYWENWLANARITHVPDPEIREFMRRSLIALSVATDRQTGAIVRSPAARPPLARDWPRHSAWMTYCYDLAGYPGLAEGHARFTSRRIRKEGRRSKPYGSLPSAVYADGIDASPHLIIDVEAVAWTLWSYRQHAEYLPPDLRKSFLLEIWPAVSMMSDFLATWKSERTGAALRTYDPSILREKPSRGAMISARLGLASAVTIAKVLDRDVSPEWNRRIDELDVFVRNMCLDESLQWTLNEALPFSLMDVLPLEDPRFENAARERLRALNVLTGVDAARALCEVAMLWQGDPGKLAQLRPYIKPAYRNVFYSGADNASGISEALNPPDALAAALAFIAAHIVFSADES